MAGNPRPSPDVVFQELDGELVLVHLRTNRIYSLNETGARLWALLSSGHAVAGICEELEREFEVDPVSLKREVAELLADLTREGLVIDPDA